MADTLPRTTPITASPGAGPTEHHPLPRLAPVERPIRVRGEPEEETTPNAGHAEGTMVAPGWRSTT